MTRAAFHAFMGSPRATRYLLIVVTTAAYFTLPGLVFTLAFISLVILCYEERRTLEALALTFIGYTLLPTPVFISLFIIIYMTAPDKYLPHWYIPLQRYLSVVAMEQTIFHMRQLGFSRAANMATAHWLPAIPRAANAAYYKALRARLQATVAGLQDNMRLVTPRNQRMVDLSLAQIIAHDRNICEEKW